MAAIVGSATGRVLGMASTMGLPHDLYMGQKVLEALKLLKEVEKVKFVVVGTTSGVYERELRQAMTASKAGTLATARKSASSSARMDEDPAKHANSTIKYEGQDGGRALGQSTYEGEQAEGEQAEASTKKHDGEKMGEAIEKGDDLSKGL